MNICDSSLNSRALNAFIATLLILYIRLHTVHCKQYTVVSKISVGSTDDNKSRYYDGFKCIANSVKCLSLYSIVKAGGISLVACASMNKHC